MSCMALEGWGIRRHVTDLPPVLTRMPCEPSPNLGSLRLTMAARAALSWGFKGPLAFSERIQLLFATLPMQPCNGCTVLDCEARCD